MPGGTFCLLPTTHTGFQEPGVSVLTHHGIPRKVITLCLSFPTFRTRQNVGTSWVVVKVKGEGVLERHSNTGPHAWHPGAPHLIQALHGALMPKTKN